MKISNVKVYGFDESIIASGYPMKASIPDESEVTEQAVNVAKNLSKCEIGTGHDNFLNGIIVQFDLRCSLKMWTQAERYHFLDFVSSQSTMHMLRVMSVDECCNEYVDARVKAVLNELVCAYNSDKTEENFLRMIYNIPSGFELTARMTTDLRQLKTIVRQRKKHRLPEWRTFCEWVESLPAYKELGE